ncbi:hypothetical protein Glove_537g11 [Diversispora epigaea]|uniref:Uncharacterized protein n=1 Tax=Diversispora epigaea TaxID=1348612 RepID=A0A397GCZ3_9GLOM|nr:hypothetical protein Glove_537g11 [Diversispora epigaea]
MNQMVINELKNDEYEEGSSSIKRKNNINEDEDDGGSEIDERPNKIKKQATNIIGEITRNSTITINRSNETTEIKEGSNEIEESNNDGYKTLPPGPQDKTIMTTFQKSTFFANSCIIMKEKQVDTISELVCGWIINVLSSRKKVFKSSIITPLTPDNKFRKTCEIILYDFFSMVNKNLLNCYTGERKYIVERIVPLFKAIQSVYEEFTFDWIEVQLNCIKDMKQLFLQFDMTINKADDIGIKVSSDKKVVFIKVTGGSEVTCAVTKHAKEDTES